MPGFWFDCYRSDTVHTVSREALLMCLLSLRTVRDPWPVSIIL